jgi:hypothetical protein
VQRIDDQSRFNVELRGFKDFLQKTAPAVKAYFEKDWEEDAPHWAAWGRGKLKYLSSDTNNLIEAFFRKLKYYFAKRRVRQRMEDLIKLLVFDVLPHYLVERIRKVCGVSTSTAEEVDGRLSKEVEWLHSTTGAVQFLNDSFNLAMALSCNPNQKGKSYKLCVGDLSCQCPANEHKLCKHVVAAATLRPLTPQVLQATADAIVSRHRSGK